MVRGVGVLIFQSTAHRPDSHPPPPYLQPPVHLCSMPIPSPLIPPSHLQPPVHLVDASVSLVHLVHVDHQKGDLGGNGGAEGGRAV